MGNCSKTVISYHSFPLQKSSVNIGISLFSRAEVTSVDLQLPKIKFSAQARAAAALPVPAEPKIRFAEKTASSSNLIGSVIKREPGESEFKKRKIGDEGKKNLRERGGDD